MVGVCRRTGTRWRNGRRVKLVGRVVNLPPVITVSPNPEKRYSPRYLSEDERVRLADLRREKRTMRDIAALMGRSTSTISRELARGADAAGRYGPFEAHRRALLRRHLHRPSRLAGDAELRDSTAGTSTQIDGMRHCARRWRSPLRRRRPLATSSAASSSLSSTATAECALERAADGRRVAFARREPARPFRRKPA